MRGPSGHMIALCRPGNCYTFNNEKTESEILLSYALIKKEKFKWSILVKILASTSILCVSPSKDHSQRLPRFGM